MARNLRALVLLLAVLGCSHGACEVPPNWVLAEALEPPRVAYSPNPVIHAQETAPGVWLWEGETVAFDELLLRIAAARSLRPEPLILFSFAEDRSCRALDDVRSRIVEAAHCASGGRPCIEGRPDELR